MAAKYPRTSTSLRFPAAQSPPAQKRIAVLIPLAVGEIVTEHGGGGLRLRHDAEREVGFRQPVQRLLDVAGGLVVVTTILKRLTAARYSRRSR